MNRSKDALITLEQFGTTLNEHEEEVEAWSPLGGAADPIEEWAQIFYGRGDERRQAAMEQGSQAATFLIHSNERTRLLTVKSRILFEGTWDIHGIAPDTPRRGEIEVTATRKT